MVCTTTMWNSLTHFILENVVCAHRCFVVFLFTFFLHCRSFSPCWPLFLIFSFSHRQFLYFSSNEICLLFLSNALALLSTSLKTLKFSRTWVCCWLFSRLSPDGLSLSKKSGLDFRFPAEEPRVAFAIPSYWVILYWYACGEEGRAYAHVIIYAQRTKILTHGAPLRAWEFRIKCLWWTKTSKTPK